MNKDKGITVGKIEQLTDAPSGPIPSAPIPVKKGVRDEDGKKLKPLAPKEYDAAGEIQKFGLKPTEMIEYVDPVTKEKKKFLLDRRGTNEEKLALALLDDNIPHEQKDSMVSMYLFEKGKQGASLLMDLLMYKGTHTKESRAFQSTMRFDFELFLQTFQLFMQDSADLIFKNLPLEVVEVEESVQDGDKVKTVKKEVVKLTRDVDANEVALVLGDFARYHRMTSNLLGQRIRAEVEKRERAKGKGIYLSNDGRPYSIHEDGDIVEVVARDREEAVKNREQEEHGKSN